MIHHSCSKWILLYCFKLSSSIKHYSTCMYSWAAFFFFVTPQNCPFLSILSLLQKQYNLHVGLPVKQTLICLVNRVATQLLEILLLHCLAPQEIIYTSVMQVWNVSQPVLAPTGVLPFQGFKVIVLHLMNRLAYWLQALQSNERTNLTCPFIVFWLLIQLLLSSSVLEESRNFVNDKEWIINKRKDSI